MIARPGRRIHGIVAMPPLSAVSSKLFLLALFLLSTPLAGCQTISDLGAFYALRRGSHQSAIRHFDRRVARHSGDPQSYRWRGLARLAAEDYEAAVSDFNRSLQLDPEDCEAFCLRGAAFAILGEFDRAISDLTAAIDVAPDEEKGELYKQRARIFSLMGDETRAQSDLAMSERLIAASESTTKQAKRRPFRLTFSLMEIPYRKTPSIQ